MKYWKIVLGAAAIAFAVNASFAGAIKSGMPKGWVGKGAIAESYEIGVDPSQGTEEHPAFFIAAKSNASKNDFAAITQVIDASPYVGKNMSLTLKVRHLGELGDYEIWLRTTDEKGATGIASTWALKSNDWQDAKIRMIIPKNVTKIELGVGLRAQGKIWVRDLTFEKTPVMSADQRDNLAKSFVIGDANSSPINLNFSE